MHAARSVAGEERYEQQKQFKLLAVRPFFSHSLAKRMENALRLSLVHSTPLSDFDLVWKFENIKWKYF